MKQIKEVTDRLLCSSTRRASRGWGGATRCFRWRSGALRLALVAVLTAASSTAFAGTADSRANSSPTIVLESVGPARLGEVIRLRLLALNARDLAGFQATVRFNASGLHVSAASLEHGLGRGGRAILPLGPVYRDASVSIGAVTCPVADCGERPGNGRSSGSGADGRVELAVLSLYASAPGRYDITLDDVRLVDPQGNSLTFDVVGGVLEVSPDGHGLGQGGAGASVRGSGAPGTTSLLDQTGNRLIDGGDAWAIIGAWLDLQTDGRCYAPEVAGRDVSPDGCVDVRDVQAVLAGWGDLSQAAEAPRRSTTLRLASFSRAGSPATLVVNSDGDGSDAVLGDGVCATSAGTCTLRAAIEEANRRPGVETINFDVRNPDGSCPTLVTIQAVSAGWVIDDANREGMTINGYSQCGAAPNTQPVGGNATITVELRGNAAQYLYGMQIYSPYNTIRGVAVYNWYRQIYVASSAAHDNIIEGVFVGTNAANTFTMGAESRAGIFFYSAPNNSVGGSAPGARNVIAGNNNDGVVLMGTGAAYNRLLGNYIGLKQDGVTVLRNANDGIDLQSGAHHNQLGGLGAGEGNVVGGNRSDGIEVSHDSSTAYNSILGNFVGVNAYGTGAVRNSKMGVTFEDGPSNNTVAGNVIGGNGSNGIRMHWLSNGQDIRDNRIGVGPDGVTPFPNGSDPAATRGRAGVRIDLGSNTTRVTNNVIAHHPESGIYVTDEGGAAPSNYNTFVRNQLFDNGGPGISIDPRSNQGLAAPILAEANPTVVSGTACGGCRVEVFIADKTVLDDPSGDNSGEGMTFIGEAVAGGSGTFSAAVSGIAPGQLVTATATDGFGNTSEFARNTMVRDGPPSTPTGVPPDPTETSPPSPTPSPPTATPTSPPASGDVLYLSVDASVTLGALSVRNEDVVTHNVVTGAYAMYFDGSDVGLAATDLDVFGLLPDGSLLVSVTTSNYSLAGFGTADDSDILRFRPTSLGGTTAGTFEMYFDGSDVGLDADSEDVDALGFLPDGRMLISLSSNTTLGALSVRDEDILTFTPASLGDITSGGWAMYFDGSDVGLGDLTTEDIMGVWVDPANGKIYLTVHGVFSVPGLTGDGADIFTCTPGSLGDTTDCTFGPGLYWDGSAHGLAGLVVDAFTLAKP